MRAVPRDKHPQRFNSEEESKEARKHGLRDEGGARERAPFFDVYGGGRVKNSKYFENYLKYYPKPESENPKPENDFMSYPCPPDTRKGFLKPP